MNNNIFVPFGPFYRGRKDGKGSPWGFKEEKEEKKRGKEKRREEKNGSFDSKKTKGGKIS